MISQLQKYRQITTLNWLSWVVWEQEIKIFLHLKTLLRELTRLTTNLKKLKASLQHSSIESSISFLSNKQIQKNSYLYRCLVKRLRKNYLSLRSSTLSKTTKVRKINKLSIKKLDRKLKKLSKWQLRKKVKNNWILHRNAKINYWKKRCIKETVQLNLSLVPLYWLSLTLNRRN